MGNELERAQVILVPRNPENRSEMIKRLLIQTLRVFLLRLCRASGRQGSLN